MAALLVRFQSVAIVAGLLTIACSDKEQVDQTPTAPEPFSQISGEPAGWLAASSTGYEVGRDILVFRSGRFSGYLRSRSTSPSPTGVAILSQSVSADAMRGQRVRLSGYLRLSDVTGEGFGLWVEIDGVGRKRGIDNMAGRRPVGTKDWAYAEIVLDVPDDALGLQFGAQLFGLGIGWVDDLKLELVGPQVAVTAPVLDTPASEPVDYLTRIYQRAGGQPFNMDFEGVAQAESEPTTVDWVRLNSIPFATDDPYAPEADLAPLDAMIGNASIIALGEATHGTRNFFRMKHRVFQYLVRHHGFNTFGIEAALPQTLAVDHYVQTGVGDAADLVRGMGFWTWSTEEVVDLVNWMKEWNAAGGQPRLRFAGFDMQSADVAVDSVLNFAQSLTTSFGDSVKAGYRCLDAARDTTALNTRISQDKYRLLASTAQIACRDALATVDSLFARRIDEFVARVGEERAHIMQRLARVVSQWEDNARTGSRDRHMAENVAWWKSRSGGAGVMLWAHNAHISRVPGWMGGFLDDRFGADYLNIGLTFSSGIMNAVMQTPTGFGGVTSHLVGGSWGGSFEALMDATGHQRAIFDARNLVTGGPIAASLRRRLTIRQIGAVFSRTVHLGTYQTLAVLPDDYDIIIWFREAGPSRLLRD